MSRASRSRIVRAVAGSVLCLTCSAGWLVAARADDTASPPPFDASSAADGFRVALEIPNAPLSSRPVDVGAPSVSSRATSLGDSHGFAAAPDPGELVQSAPGLVVGLVSQGAAGLPPIPLPSLPSYPLLLNSDISGPQHATLGQGPYELEADSVTDHSSAKGETGLQLGLATVADVEATSESGLGADGTVVATATSDVQGLTVGPLTLGRVTSTATMTLQPDGSVRPTSQLHLSGVKIGGIDVALTDEGLQLASVPVPLPVSSSLHDLLRAVGLDVQLFGAQQFANTVIAPTLVISRTVNAGIGTAPGTVSLTIGAASATLTGPTPTPSSGGNDGVGPAPTGSSASGAAPTHTASPVRAASGSNPTAGTSSAPSTPLLQPAAAAATAPEPITGLFDIRPTYLALAAGAAGVYVLSQLLSLLGVRMRWTFAAG